MATVKSLHGWPMHQIRDRAPLFPKEKVTIASLIEVIALLEGWMTIAFTACGGGRRVCVCVCVDVGNVRVCISVCVCVEEWYHLSRLWLNGYSRGGSKKKKIRRAHHL